MEKVVVPARQGRAVRVANGRCFRIVTPQGKQAADFFAYNEDNVDEWLSANITWTWTKHVRPRVGDTFLSRFRRPMLDFVDDTANGVHDMMIAACDQFRYEQLGCTTNHESCSDNLCTAMRREGYNIDVIPQPVNFFTNTRINEDGIFVAESEPQAPVGSYVELKARMDLICVVSACPYDLDLADWQVNGGAGQPTEIEIEFLV